MKIYHGTAERHLGSILANGLRPRILSGESNWTHSIESNPDTVYLTTSYALYFALSALDTDDLENDRAVVLEIETDGLDSSLLVPDEDALEQIDRGMTQISREQMVARTRRFRDQVRSFSSRGYDWEWSLKKLGTCGYQGVISPDQISRVALIDIAKSSELAYVFYDASLTVMNHHILGGRNLVIHQSIFGDTHSEYMDYNGFFPLPPIGDGVQIISTRKNHVTL